MKLLVLSDVSINADMGGFSQTLYNVFSFVQPEDFLFVTSSTAYKTALPSEPFRKRAITYKFEVIWPQRNRFAKYVNTYIDWFNFNFNYWFRSFNTVKKAIRQFNPDVVIAAPNGQEGLFMYHALRPAFENKKIFPYFMDDWLHKPRMRWFGGGIHLLAKSILGENKAWIMVSKNLADIFSERYTVKPQSVLEIHNPVELTGDESLIPLQKKQQYTFAYAGSLWQMHFDAFLAIAKAIKILTVEKQLRFIVYTQQGQWEWRKKELESLQVEFGGSISYKKIHEKLIKADFLVITSSFEKEFYTHSKASVQTKLTDYLKAGKLILSCGPSYSANHQFIKKHQCGICIETIDENTIAKTLDKILEEPALFNQHAINGMKTLQAEFSFEKVHMRLQQYLKLS